MTEAKNIGLRVQLAMLREQHNTLAGVEDMCTGTAAKLKRYAPLLRRIAKWKAGLRIECTALHDRIVTRSPENTAKGKA